MAREVDLSFLDEEEAQQIFHVLERNSRLKKAERERISKLHKKREDTTGLLGVTGEWFEEIQKRKFRSETDISRMIKQPLAHRLRKAMKTDSTTVKPSASQTPQAQKHGSPSILGGLRTPFVSLFSSFRKPKRQPLKPPPSPPRQHRHPPRYDRFVPGRRMPSKAEEMAKTETCNSPLATKLTNKKYDAKQAEEDNSATWNDQLENELLRVLGNLDEQLAQEQAQGQVKRTANDYSYKTSDTNQYPTVTRQSFRREVQRTNRSMFLPDGTRTLRPSEEPQNFFRPRTLYDTYMKKYHVEDYASQNVLDRRSSASNRWFSTRSLGHSSEGSLEHLSGPCGTGFRRRDFPCTNTVSRSYSLSSLSRRHSSGSADELSTDEDQQHLLAAEGNRRFTQRNCHHRSKRTPLSSVVWNTPHSSERSSVQDRILRTQSLMDFGPKFEGTYTCTPWDNTKYEFYRSNINQRRSLPNPSHSSRVGYPDKLTDSLCFDHWEKNALHQPKRNIASPLYKYSSLRGRMPLFSKRFASGRMEGQPLGPDGHQCYNDDPFLTSNADFERIPTNRHDWQNACAKNTGLQQRESNAQNNVEEHVRNVDHLEGETAEGFLKHTRSVENHLMYTSTSPLPFIRGRPSNQPVLSDSKGPAKYAAQRQNLFTRSGQSLMKPLNTHTQAKEGFQTVVSEELRDTGQSSRACSEDCGEEISGPVSEEVYTSCPAECPPKNSLSHSGTSLKRPVSLASNMQAKSASSRNTEKIYLSSTQNRNGQNKENEHALNRDLDQKSPSWSVGSRTRDSFIQSLQHGARQSESLRVSMHKKQRENIRSPGFSRALKVFECGALSDPCTEKPSKHRSFVRHATSNSVTSSPSSSPPKSPIAYYTLPRKSASIDGSVISRTPLSSPKRSVPFENQAAMENNLETLISNRNERSSWSQRDKIAFANPAHSSLHKDVTNEGNVPRTEGHPPNPAFHATNQSVRKLERSTITCCLDKSETTVLSDGEEMDAEKSLQKCKTTSMVTVSVDEDNIKYHELISVYYTLPRKYSRTLGKLFLDDSNNGGSSTSSVENPSQKYVPSGLEATGFPCNFEKADSPAKISTTPGISQSSKIPDQAEVENRHVRSAITNLVLTPHSRLIESNRKEAVEHLMRAEALSGNRPPSLTATNLKSPSGNVTALSSTLNTRNVQKESPSGCQPLDESSLSNNPHIHSSGLMDNEKRKCTLDLATDAPVSSTEEKMRGDARVKERARHICRILALHRKKENGLQPRDESVTRGTGETLTSQTTVQAYSDNQTPQAEAATEVNTSLQPNIPVTCVLKSPNPKQEQMLQNNPAHTVCTSSQIAVSSSVDSRNLNSEDQLPDTTLELPDRSTTENNLASESAHGETEKRKNRSSIKNKLTGRRFSSKKNFNPKPHVSSIFSQNDSLSSETSGPLLISSDAPQSLLQIGVQDQNLNPLPAELNITMSGKPENEKSQTDEGPPLLTNENRRPFTNLCNQKREIDGSRHSDKNTENSLLNPAGLCHKRSKSTLNHSQAHNEGLKNSPCPLVSRVATGDPSQKNKVTTAVGESSLFPPSFDKNSKQQKAVSLTGYDHYQNVKHPNRLKSQNLPQAEPSPSKPQRERHFSESSYTREPHKILTPKSSLSHHHRRKFNSYSELLSCDENENWEAYSDRERTFGSRQLMYPSVDFGIFGKEQQQAFLDNIKRSLTEGRLWRPCLLKNPGFLRKEEGCSLSKSELLNSSFAEGNKSKEGSLERKPVDVCEEEVPAGYSESDSDTTTDDEYYPNEHDKESEL